MVQNHYKDDNPAQDNPHCISSMVFIFDRNITPTEQRELRAFMTALVEADNPDSPLPIGDITNREEIQGLSIHTVEFDGTVVIGKNIEQVFYDLSSFNSTKNPPNTSA